MNRNHRAIIASLLIVLMLPVALIHAQDAPPSPPPTTYDAVTDQYRALQTTTTERAEAVLDALWNGEYEAVYDQFTPDFQQMVALEQLEAGMTQIGGGAAIGEQADYRILPAPDGATYVAQYDFGTTGLVVGIGLTNDNQIDGLQLQPVPALPDDPAADYTSETTFHLPYDGLWYTFWGGTDALHNYHVSAAPQRHAYDFVIWQDGSTFSGDGTQNSDYYAYGQPVLAPAAGTVVTVVDGLPESLPQVETDTQNPAGNHVVIEVAQDEYVFLAHMQPGSIQVAEGDSVEVGQPLGLTGNSGNTSEPHIHIHLQDTPEMFVRNDAGQITALTDAVGLPLPYADIVINGEPVDAGLPVGGDFARNSD